jgi:predicted transcriptional regulator
VWFDDIDIGGRGLVHPAQGPLGRALRQLRHDLFMSQAQLARAAGVSQPVISRLERGAPNWRIFHRCVDAVGGQPVVTVTGVETEKMLWERLFAAAAEGDTDYPT